MAQNNTSSNEELEKDISILKNNINYLLKSFIGKYPEITLSIEIEHEKIFVEGLNRCLSNEIYVKNIEAELD